MNRSLYFMVVLFLALLIGVAPSAHAQLLLDTQMAVQGAGTVQANAPKTAVPTAKAESSPPGAVTGIFPGTPIEASLFFSPEEMRKINTAVEIYRMSGTRRSAQTASKGAQDFIDLLKDDNKVQRIVHPQFFLASIAIHTPQEWVVWVNTLKLSSQYPVSGDLTVQSVDETRATFIWKPSQFLLYRDKKPPSGQPIVINAERETIVFTLYPNQTFSSYTMRIDEGWKPPAFVEEIKAGVGGALKALAPLGKMPEMPDMDTDSLPRGELPDVPKVGIYHPEEQEKQKDDSLTYGTPTP